MKRLFPAACSFYLWPPPNRPIGVSKVGSPMRLLRKSPVFQTNLSTWSSPNTSGFCWQKWEVLRTKMVSFAFPASKVRLGFADSWKQSPRGVWSCFGYFMLLLPHLYIVLSHCTEFPFVTRHPFISYKHHIISYPIVVVKKCQESVGSLLFTKP